MGKSYVGLFLLNPIPLCEKCGKSPKFKIHGEGKNPDQLEYEPTSDQILSMDTQEQNDLVRNARMKEGCNPDDQGNRAKIRACYLINEAYKSQGHMQNGEQQ